MKGWVYRYQSPPVYCNETLRHPTVTIGTEGRSADLNTAERPPVAVPTDPQANISVKDFRPHSPFGRPLGAALVATVSAALVAVGYHRLPPTPAVGVFSAFGGRERWALSSVLLGCFLGAPGWSLTGSLPSGCWRPVAAYRGPVPQCFQMPSQMGDGSFCITFVMMAGETGGLVVPSFCLAGLFIAAVGWTVRASPNRSAPLLSDHPVATSKALSPRSHWC